MGRWCPIRPQYIGRSYQSSMTAPWQWRRRHDVGSGCQPAARGRSKRVLFGLPGETKEGQGEGWSLAGLSEPEESGHEFNIISFICKGLWSLGRFQLCEDLRKNLQNPWKGRPGLSRLADVKIYTLRPQKCLWIFDLDVGSPWAE